MQNSLSDILDQVSGEETDLKGGTITIWVSADMKARYDALQKLSRRRFAQKTRETIKALIVLAEAKEIARQELVSAAEQN
jgi:hypothetical protein